MQQRIRACLGADSSCHEGYLVQPIFDDSVKVLCLINLATDLNVRRNEPGKLQRLRLKR